MGVSNSDQSLLALSPAALAKSLAVALRYAREGDLPALAQTPLAACSLIDDWCVAATPSGVDDHGRALQTLLFWLIERLRPAGTPSHTALAWRPYHVLHGFYGEGRRIAELAEQLAVSEQAIYPIRAQALAILERLLRAELARPAAERPNYAIQALYPALPPPQQLLLRACAIVPEAISAELLYQLAGPELAPLEPHLQELVASGMLSANTEFTAYALQPKLRPFLRAQSSPAERQRWHRCAAEAAERHADYAAALHHRRLAGDQASAALIIVEHHPALSASSELHHSLSELHAAEIGDPSLWARLKIVSGDIASASNDFPTALAEYQQALAAPDRAIKAEAYHKRGKAFRHIATAEAQAHFAYAISLLEGASQPALLLQVYLDQAWLQFQDLRDLPAAEATLRAADALVDSADRSSWAALTNAWGMFHSHSGDHRRAIECHQQAWLAANEAQDPLLLTYLAHNLGNDYMALGDYDQARRYFAQSADLAQQTANRRMEGLCYKSMGACSFWLADYPAAIAAYLQARAIFTAMDNRNWLANTCYDLAEAYAELGDQAAMRAAFADAVALAQAAGLDRLLADLANLARAYPGLYPPGADLSPRQQLLYDYLKQHPAISNRAYRELTAVSPKQAARDLAALVEAGIISRSGDGRATEYRLA